MAYFRFSPAKLQAIRKQLGWSRYRLAVAAQTTEPTVFRWEKSGVAPNRASLVKVAAALGVEPSDLCEPDPLFEVAK